MKIHTVKLYQEFNAPIEEVWSSFNDHETMGKIMGQKSSRVVDSPDPNNVNGVNSVRRLSVPLMPFEETIRKSEKPFLIEYQVSKGTPLNHHYGTMAFKKLAEDKCAIDYSIEVGSNIPFLGGVVKSVLEKGIGDGLKNYAKRIDRLKTA